MKQKMQIVISVSEPWEFYEDDENSNIFYAELIDYQDDCVLFSSYKLITLRSKTGEKQWRNFFGSPRYAEKNIITKIATQDGCDCNVIAVADDTSSISEAKQQAHAWRGCGAFIGNIKML